MLRDSGFHLNLVLVGFLYSALANMGSTTLFLPGRGRSPCSPRNLPLIPKGRGTFCYFWVMVGVPTPYMVSRDTTLEVGLITAEPCGSRNSSTGSSDTTPVRKGKYTSWLLDKGGILVFLWSPLNFRESCLITKRWGWKSWLCTWHSVISFLWGWKSRLPHLDYACIVGMVPQFSFYVVYN